ncbi:MAG: hypothetical protein GXP62_04450, partial [Oligoflexia bacterium]|nr:hypothetical protein [Oligoflexia bacterium]
MTSPAPGPAAPPAPSVGPPWARWAGLAILLLVLAAYLPLLGAGYVWDDQDLILKNTAITSLSNWPQLFSQDLWAGTPLAGDGSGFYRPLVALSLAFDHALAPGSAAFAHAHSLAWHLLACLLLWCLLRRSVGVVGAAAGLPLFALHPVQTEAVAWISARNDPMAAALLFGALLLLDRDRPSPGALLGGAVLLLAALLAKESALLAPAMLALVAVARTGRPGRLRSHLAVLLALCIYAALRTWAGVALPPRADLLHIEAAAPPALAHFAQDVLW